MSSPPAQQPALSLTSLPAAVSERILRQLPLADRVRAGGVSPAWRPVAHAPALYGPELKLSDALDAPRTVADASAQQQPGGRRRPALERAGQLRCSSLAVLRSLAALAAGTLTALHVTHSDFSIPDAVWSEEIVAICAANPALTRVTAATPSNLPGALQLLRRCPRVRTLLVTRLRTASRSHGITAETIAALTPEERLLSARLALDTLDLGRKMCEGPSPNEYLPPLPDYVGALTSVEVRASLASLRETVAAVGAGAWAVGELHLPGCKNEDALLVDVFNQSISSQPLHYVC